MNTTTNPITVLRDEWLYTTTFPTIIELSETYQRQSPLGLHIPESAFVFGCGGIGTYVAQYLAMSGVPKLTLWDDDTLEESNRARLPYTPEDVGQKKVELLEKLILSLRPGIDITSFGRANPFVLSILPVHPDFVFDCTDNGAAMKVIHDWCKAKEIKYIKAGYDGLNITVTDKVTAWKTETALEGYAITPSWIVPATIAAGLAVMKAFLGLSENFYGAIDKISMKE